MRSFLKLNSVFFFMLLLPVISFSQKDIKGARKQYNIDQAISDKAQLHTIAFDGLAFLTGSFGADCFFPPGKVADFFGFQYMRDNDSNSLGHNTDFLTRIASNVLSILNQQQLDKFIALAKEQEYLYDDFAKKRIVLIKGFRESMEQHRPLNKAAVVQYGRELYAIDGALSYRRAEVMGELIRSFSNQQIAALEKLSFSNSATWPEMQERLDKRTLSHRAHVGVMTYASELFSWYKGSVQADVYFCPERHGTYFGGFYLKDYPAMGNKGYSISTALTGESGKAFLDILTPEQRMHLVELPAIQKQNMNEIVRLRQEVSAKLRGFFTGQKIPKEEILELVMKYGEQDAELSYHYINAFSAVNISLSNEQRKKMRELRGLDVEPQGIYIFSDPEPVPQKIDCSFLFNASAAGKKMQ